MASKRCAIHQDAYGTDYICKTCREDPANKDWVETSGRKGVREVSVENYRDTDAPAVFDGVSSAHRDWTETERGVALGLLLGKSENEISQLLGVSARRVRQIKDKFLDGKDIDMTRPDFAWMTEESQQILSLLVNSKLTDAEIAQNLDVDIAHVSRMRVFFGKVKRRVPYTEK
jgi:transposase